VNGGDDKRARKKKNCDHRSIRISFSSYHRNVGTSDETAKKTRNPTAAEETERMNDSFNSAPIQTGGGEVPFSSKGSHVIHHRTHTPSLNPLSLPMGRKSATRRHTTHVCPRYGLVRGPEMAHGQKRKDGFPVRRPAESRR
jgi:hypothetical protein